jgi:hypothetical protein
VPRTRRSSVGCWSIWALARSRHARRRPRERIERLWGTLQDRLVAELRLAGITTPEAVTADFLTTYLERHNAAFAVPANDPGSAYRPLPPTLDRERLLSFRYGRVVNHDNTVQFNGQVLQIPPGPRRRGYAKARVWVHELLDGALGVWHDEEQRWLLRTNPSGSPVILRARRAKSPPDPTPRSTPPLQDASPQPSSAPHSPWKPGADHPWRR